LTIDDLKTVRKIVNQLLKSATKEPSMAQLPERTVSIVNGQL
jgi:hypothetical protein